MHKSHRTKSLLSISCYCLALLIFYIGHELVLTFVFGISLNLELYGTHLIDPMYLEKSLFKSLLYLHSQPPMMNIIVYLSLIAAKLINSSPEGILKSLYLILGFCALWWIYSIGKILSPFKKIGVSIAILALLNPGFALFQKQGNYKLPTLCFLMGILLYGYLYLNKGLKHFEKISLQKINSLAAIRLR